MYFDIAKALEKYSIPLFDEKEYNKDVKSLMGQGLFIINHGFRSTGRSMYYTRCHTRAISKEMKNHEPYII